MFFQFISLKLSLMERKNQPRPILPLLITVALLVAGLALVTATAGEEEHEQRECSADPESCLGEAARPAPGIPALDELTEAQRAELARVWVDNGLAEHASGSRGLNLPCCTDLAALHRPPGPVNQ